MNNRQAVFALMAGVLLATGTGCHQAFVAESHASHAWRLDNDHTIVLQQESSRYSLSNNPKYNYQSKSFQLVSAEGGVEMSVVERSEGRAAELGYVDPRTVEVRTDSSRRRICILDKESRQALAIFDREAETITRQCDELPGWAESNDVVILQLQQDEHHDFN
ncbi:MAG: hypothetical protein MI923_04215 [Phycisphaerales bacterium]|nr:hypothetical protein [Phycisphaerales bacterium]